LISFGGIVFWTRKKLIRSSGTPRNIQEIIPAWGEIVTGVLYAIIFLEKDEKRLNEIDGLFIKWVKVGRSGEKWILLPALN